MKTKRLFHYSRPDPITEERREAPSRPLHGPTPSKLFLISFIPPMRLLHPAAIKAGDPVRRGCVRVARHVCLADNVAERGRAERGRAVNRGIGFWRKCYNENEEIIPLFTARP